MSTLQHGIKVASADIITNNQHIKYMTKKW